MSTVNSVIVPFHKTPDSIATKLSIGAYVENEVTDKALNSVLSTFDDFSFTVSKLEANNLPDLASGVAPNILILELSDSADTDAKRLDHFSNYSKSNGCSLVVVAEALSQTDMLKYLRMGANDFLTVPFDHEEVFHVLSRLVDRVMPKNHGEDTRKVISFFHASGGVGATTVAVNAALELCQIKKDSNCKVCLMDFDLQFGDIAMQLDIGKVSPMLELLENPDRLDAELLKAMMIKYSDRLDVLTTPAIPIPYSAFDRELIDRIVSLARENYDYVLIDMPPCLTDWTDYIVKNSSEIFLVTKLEVPALRQVGRLLEAFELEGISTDNIDVVVNQYSGSPFLRTTEDVDIKQAQRSLKRNLRFTLPAVSGIMRESMNTGQPAVLGRSKSGYAKSVAKLVRSFADLNSVKVSRLSRA